MEAQLWQQKHHHCEGTFPFEGARVAKQGSDKHVGRAADVHRWAAIEEIKIECPSPPNAMHICRALCEVHPANNE